MLTPTCFIFYAQKYCKALIGITLKDVNWNLSRQVDATKGRLCSGCFATDVVSVSLQSVFSVYVLYGRVYGLFLRILYRVFLHRTPAGVVLSCFTVRH